MPQWTSAPDQSPAPWAFRIVRTPPTGALDAIITCQNVTGCPTHFANNRTIPCEGQPNCKLCQQGFSWRWHGYVSAILVRTMEHIVWEATAAATEALRTYLTIHPDLRGCHFKASRPSGRPNGRVLLQVRRDDLERIRLPDPPNLQKILCHIWGCQYTEDTEPAMDRPPFRRLKISPGNGQDARYSGSPKEPA